MAKGWYIVHTYSGYEQKIQRTIMKLREMDDDFALIVTDVKVPMETVTEIKDGKKKEVANELVINHPESLLNGNMIDIDSRNHENEIEVDFRFKYLNEIMVFIISVTLG